MEEVGKIILEFLLIFLLVYVCDYLFSYKKLKKYDRKKAPLNINYLVLKYKIDVVKIGYKKIAKSLIMCDSFIISFLFTITRFINNIYIRLITCFILVFPLFAGIYHLVAKYYKKESEK